MYWGHRVGCACFPERRRANEKRDKVVECPRVNLGVRSEAAAPEMPGRGRVTGRQSGCDPTLDPTLDPAG